MQASEMASMITPPREGHLSAVFQTFSFLKSKHSSVTVFDPTEPGIVRSLFGGKPAGAYY